MPLQPVFLDIPGSVVQLADVREVVHRCHPIENGAQARLGPRATLSRPLVPLYVLLFASGRPQAPPGGPASLAVRSRTAAAGAVCPSASTERHSPVTSAPWWWVMVGAARGRPRCRARGHWWRLGRTQDRAKPVREPRQEPSGDARHPGSRHPGTAAASPASERPPSRLMPRSTGCATAPCASSAPLGGSRVAHHRRIGDRYRPSPASITAQRRAGQGVAWPRSAARGCNSSLARCPRFRYRIIIRRPYRE